MLDSHRSPNSARFSESHKKSAATCRFPQPMAPTQRKWVLGATIYLLFVHLLVLWSEQAKRPWVLERRATEAPEEVTFLSPSESVNCGATVDESSLARLPTIHVAIVLYGMARNTCPAANIAEVFVKPLHVYSRRHHVAFVYDLFVDANVANRSSSVRWGVKNSPVDPRAWQKVKACFNQVRKQRQTDEAIEPVYQATFGRFGDAWEDETGSTTKNLLRALYSQKEAAELVKRTEGIRGKRYDVVLVSRLDVLHTLPTPSEAYAAIVHARDVRKEQLLFSPNWQRHFGYNDRYFMGERDAALRVLSRFDRVKEFVDLKQRAINSEEFLGWIFGEYFIKSAGRKDHAFKVVLVDWVANRRVRSTNQTEDDKFDWRELRCGGPCKLFSFRHCHTSVIKDMPTCDCAVVEDIRIVPRPNWLELSFLGYY